MGKYTYNKKHTQNLGKNSQNELNTFLFSAILKKVKYRRNICPIFLLKGGLDDTSLKGGLKEKNWGSSDSPLNKKINLFDLDI
jgi:hypothetical protein